LLQRIGRLHRHVLPRPPGFETPGCLVLSPEAGLAPLLTPTFENGLGGWREAGVLNGIYRDLSVVELTRRLVVAHLDWIIPAMNRFLVESATHPEPIEALHRELGPTWEAYRNDVYGKDVAEAGAAANVALPVTQPFADLRFPEDEAKIRTRLGGEGARIVFAAPVAGPFGIAVSGVTLPPHWSHGIDPDERVVPVIGEGVVTFRAGGTGFRYGRFGLSNKT
jgi:CRISPR-associated endonuclease/helicase Cas3